MISSAIIGYYADRTTSRRTPYLLGLLFLLLSTFGLSLGSTLTAYLISRFIQGASSTVVHIVGMAILADTAGTDDVGLAMGFVDMSSALGLILGPVLGGILYHHSGYKAVFVSAYVLVAVDFVLRVGMIMPEAKPAEDEGEELDAVTHDYRTIAVPSPVQIQQFEAAWTFGSRRLPHQHSKTPPPPLYPLHRLHPSNPQPWNFQPPSPPPIFTLLTFPRMLTAILGEFVQSTILTALESTLPLRFNLLLHYDSSRVGLLFMVLAIPAFFAPLIEMLSDRFGAKVILGLGYCGTGVLVTLLLFLGAHGPASERGMLALIIPLLFALGTSLGFILTPSWAEATYAVKDLSKRRLGVSGTGGAYATAFGLMEVSYAVGSLVGPLVGGLGTEVWGWEGLVMGMGIVCAICVGPVVLFAGGRKEKDELIGRGEDG